VTATRFSSLFRVFWTQTNPISGDVLTLTKFLEWKSLAKLFDIFVQESESNSSSFFFIVLSSIQKYNQFNELFAMSVFHWFMLISGV
jgi:hypothetical protein